ncbi:MAG: galactosyltransferase-related protein, partial [Chthoniobacteraceae bacterium]
CVGSLEIEEMPGNLGAAGTYNHLLLRLGPCVIAANDTRFAPGTLARCMEFMEARRDHALHFLYAMCVFSLTQVFMEETGWFDENFWPWGWDDIDVSYRMKKRGLKTAIFTRDMGTIFHDHPTQSIFSSPEPLRKWMQRTAGTNNDLGMRKWGIRPEHLGMLNKNNKWAIDTAVMRDAGNAWSLDLELRRQRIESLKAEVGIESPLCFCRTDNGGIV